MKKFLLILMIFICGLNLSAQQWVTEAREVFLDSTYIIETFTNSVNNATTEVEVEEAVLLFSEQMKDLAARAEELEARYPEFDPELVITEEEILMQEEIMGSFMAAMFSLAQYAENEVIMNALTEMGESF
jgi:predicted nuclease with TOPRIM domain